MSVVFPTIVFVVLPAAIRFSRTRRILNEIRSSDSVCIEEFLDGTVLERKTLDEAQRAALESVLPRIVPHGFPVSLKLCFVPHHRIIMQSSDETMFDVTVCFGCDQARHTDSEIYDMPVSASKSLREFLEANGIPVRELEEYASIPHTEPSVYELKAEVQ
jgi:hypothetical protein